MMCMLNTSCEICDIPINKTKNGKRKYCHNCYLLLNNIINSLHKYNERRIVNKICIVCGVNIDIYGKLYCVRCGKKNKNTKHKKYVNNNKYKEQILTVQDKEESKFDLFKKIGLGNIKI